MCYSDDNKVGATNAQRANLANLFSNTAAYTRAISTAEARAIVFDFEFKSPVVFTSMTLTKTDLVAGAGDYDDFYKNTCLSVVQNDGVSTDHPKTTTLCTDETFGFSGTSADNTADIVFGDTLAGLTNVVSAELVFDSTAGAGNSNGQTVGIAQLAMNTTP